MNNEEHAYVAIDLKSFFASVECVEQSLDPLKDYLVVADSSRTEKTICLAVSPALKAFGVPGRPRLFEVVQRMQLVNTERKKQGLLPIEYHVAPPRMSLYMEYSTRIYNIYLKYVDAADMHVYSVDEVFMDVTHYLKVYGLSTRELTEKMILDVFRETHITATAGIGSNLYLCKIAMDIVAKHAKPDKNGARIAELDEESYRKLLWSHRPLTDFWRVGRGYSKKLEQCGLMTMGDIARCSLGKPEEFYNEDLLYRMFGINAELLIDHAWGWEPCTIADIKSYRSENNSMGSGQVLKCPYTFEKAELIVKEMTDLLTLDLVEKGLVTDQIVLTVGYDIENLSDPVIRKKYKGPVTTDHYGRQIPKQAHGSINLPQTTNSTKLIIDAALQLFGKIMNRDLLIRRIYVSANHVIMEECVKKPEFEQMDIFSYLKGSEEKQIEDRKLEKEKKLQQAVLSIKNKYGKNAILKGMNFEEGGTTIERNSQIGGHKA